MDRTSGQPQVKLSLLRSISYKNATAVQVCRSYLHGRGLVWFNISQDNAGGWLNEEITLGKHTGVVVVWLGLVL
jgi:hypothetical protein